MVPASFEAYDRLRHEAFVRASWTRGARRPWGQLADRLRRPGTRCVVACHPDDPDTLLGWGAVEDGAVWFVYVRDLYGRLRRQGLGRALLAAAGVDLSKPIRCRVWTPAAQAIEAAGKPLMYCPFER